MLQTATLGVPEKLALRTVREVVTRVLVAFDALYAEQYPEEEGLMEQLKAKEFKAPEPEALEEQAASGKDNGVAQVSALERAQQLKLLRVLRHIVLPEMVPRVLA